jgi:2'-5' RNA ligase
MENPKSLRLFYALWPDEATRTALRQLQRSLPLTGRPVPPENQHVTLAFLGDQPADRLSPLTSILNTLPQPPAMLTLDKLGYFKSSRIAWVGMQNAPEALMNLQAELVEVLQQEGFAFDRHGHFTPHVTLARSASPLPNAKFQPIEWHTAHIALVQSILGPRGSRYEVLTPR